MTDSPLRRDDVPAPPRPYLDGLNEAQRAAVEAVDGPVLVLAGAGTGKTRVLTTRLAHILMTGRAMPGQILAVTFTNKAALEMKERIAALIGRPVEGWWLGTFHALGARILRRHAELVGLKPNFTILDTDDQVRLVKQLLQAADIDDRKWPARAILGVIERWKDRGLTPEKVGVGEQSDLAGGRILEIYRDYQDRLRTLNACDFGDLLLHNLTLFTREPELLRSWQRRFRYILVDEYQDTNVAQYLWLRLLAQEHRNICCVGDDDQCLAAGTRVTMADGTPRPIEAIRPGDSVLSNYGTGDLRPARVTDVFRRRRKGDGIAITTCAGRRLVSTPEHTHFAGYRLGTTPQTYFVYLMHKRGVGYRLGTTQVYTEAQRKPVVGFRQRLLQEHGDALWVLGTHPTENDARAEEYVLSLRYQIPTLPFTPRKGKGRNGLVHDPAYLARIFRSFDTEASAVRLLTDLGLDPCHPHHRPRSRNASRRNVVVTLCGDRRGASPMHRISMVGNDSTGREALESLGLSVRTAKAGSASWRYETAAADYRIMCRVVDRISTVLDVSVINMARLGKTMKPVPESNSLPFVQAAAVMPGMAVFAEDGTYDVVERVERVPLDGPVYDLNVDRTHNFIANGVVTHNSVYGWRGAEIGNILRFEADFPGARIVRLERNYRSTHHILGAASGLIARNEGRLGKTLWTESEAGEKVRLHGIWDGEEEARLVGDEVEALQRKGVSLSEMAVLVRAGFQTRAFEERFITLGIPYRLIGGPRFYERQEIRDAIAYLRVLHQPDDDLAFERIVNRPRRGIGDTTVRTLHAAARAQGTAMTTAAAGLVETDELKTAARRALRTLLDDFDRWRALAADTPHTDLAQVVLDESGYTAMWQADKSPEAPGRLENLKELIVAMEEFENLGGFLEHISLVMENAGTDAGEKVNVMTLHGAKGLEFDVVFLPGWEEGLFPHQRALDESGTAGLEEERRLAYVGLTRARHRAYVSYAANRRIHNLWQSAIPSRFVGELPGEHVEALPGLGLQGGADARRGTGFAAWPADGGAVGGGAGGGRGGPSGRRQDLLIEGEARPVAEPSRGRYAAGARVFHRKFGYGRVATVDGERLEIEFDKAGPKKVMASFVVPADQAG